MDSSPDLSPFLLDLDLDLDLGSKDSDLDLDLKAMDLDLKAMDLDLDLDLEALPASPFSSPMNLSRHLGRTMGFLRQSLLDGTPHYVNFRQLLLLNRRN